MYMYYIDNEKIVLYGYIYTKEYTIRTIRTHSANSKLLPYIYKQNCSIYKLIYTLHMYAI